MKKNLHFVSIALLALTLFSCNKNEWTPENESEYKKGMKESLESKVKGMFSDEQIDYVTNCSFEKLKSKNIKPDDAQTPENSAIIVQMGKECIEEAISKNVSKAGIDNKWDSKIEENFKGALKNKFIKEGTNREDASFLADCAMNKLKQENIGPADLQNPENREFLQNIGKICGEELMKKK